ncbi:hypothetical protein [Leptospira weilii]|nr:hypothetical protein [Leptospira weilii]
MARTPKKENKDLMQQRTFKQPIANVTLSPESCNLGKIPASNFFSFQIGFFAIVLFFVFGNCMGATLFKPGGRVRSPALYDSATIIRTSEYDILEESEGESSTFFLFGMIPITNPISIDYALSQAVQKVPGGKSLINIKVWHETHVMFPLGTVSVLKIKGSVIGNKEEAKKERLRLESEKKESSADPTPSKDEKRNPNSSSGGISVGGTKKD